MGHQHVKMPGERSVPDDAAIALRTVEHGTAGARTTGDAVPVGRLAAMLHAAIAADRLSRDASAEPRPGSGDAGMELAALVLWGRILRFDSSDPRWPDRDRFVLSSSIFLPLLRALLRLTGHAAVPPGCAFGQHPAIETAAGPPGQGFATAVGMAMAERALARRFGRTLVDHRTWVLACESDLAAGVSLEAASLAGQMRLDKLVVLFRALPATGAGGSPDTMTRFIASGWAVRRVASDDAEAIASAVAGAMRSRRPTLIACHPGSSRLDGSGLPGAIDDQRVAAAWRACGQRGVVARRGWLRRLARHRLRPEFERAMQARLPPDWKQGWPASLLPASPASLDAARQALGHLDALLPELATLHSAAGAPLLEGLTDTGAAGSADHPIRHLSCGVQEHGMAALLNGLSLHGGLRPVLAASLVSIDRMRPALRLAALMGQPVIYLLTGDGLALGEDGAGWQPVEQLASLRAMPEVSMLRPADPVEVAACWELALQHGTGPSLIALCPRPPPGNGLRAGLALPEQRRYGCGRGGYLLLTPERPRAATLIATGPEVAIALQAAERLQQAGIATAVVSLPCWDLFAAQPASYRLQILGEVLRIGIEAASGFGWERWLGPDGIFIGMDGFGAAASADTLYRQFGITPDAIAARVGRHLGVTSPTRGFLQRGTGSHGC